MKHLIGLAVLGFAALGASLLQADTFPERKSGKVLILANQRTLEGDIERLGDRFRIRRRSGGELWIPAGKDVHLCSDWQDAFALMSSQANLLDADERIRLAKWCQGQGLYDLALKEIQFALQLRPRDVQAQRLKEMLQHQARNAEPRPAEQPAPLTSAAPPPLDVGVQSLAMFASRVQPILTNTCLSCHQADRGTRFPLFRVTQTTYRHALEHNLVSALSQIDTDNPDLSPLLCKAVSNHGGGGKAPIAGRDTVPFQIMRSWVAQVLDSNPHLRASRTAVAAVAAPVREIPHFQMAPTPEQHEVPKEASKVVEKDNLFATRVKEPTIEKPAPQQPPASETLERKAPMGLPELPAAPLLETTPQAVPMAEKLSAPPAPPRNFDFANPVPAPSVTPPSASPAPSFDAYDPANFNRKMHPNRP